MNKARNLLQKHFDTAFDTPDGIKKLRELILTLAMQGKLVPQDPNDQPASELLKEIAAEKARLIKQGKLKPQKPLPPIKPEEIPYGLPQTWEWVRFGEIALIERGGSPRPIKAYITDKPDGLNWIKISDTDQGGKYITETKEKIRPEGLTKTRMVYPGDFLLTNSMSFGRPYITQIEGCIHDGWLRISPPSLLEKDYLYYLLSSSFVRKMFELAAAGAVVLNLNSDKVRELPIPLPPTIEQKRIVARVEHLMARCDELEKLRVERDKKRLETHAAAINALLSAPGSDDFDTAWKFIRQNFAELYSVKENVTELRKTILQLAVMGKLVPQDPNDQPASELLKEIAAEKAHLIKSGKLKPNDNATPDSLIDISFSIPAGWQLVRLNDLVIKIGSGSTPRGGKNVYLPNGVAFLRSQNIWNDGIRLDDVVFISEATHKKMLNTAVIAADILLNITGASLGRCSLVPDTFVEANVSQHVTIIRFVDPEIRQFMHCFFLSPFCQSMIWQRQVGMAREGLSKKVLELFEIPVPPLAEQKRIVARVAQLMALCDNLEESIDSATNSRITLLKAILAKV